VPQNLQVQHSDGEHDFQPAAREHAYKLFDDILR